MGLGLYVHQQTRSKKVINTLSGLHLSITYKRVLQIETDIANSVDDNTEKNNEIYVPPNIFEGIPIHFAIGNTDFSNDTPDGKHEFHGTGQVVFQKRQEMEREHLKIERSKSGSLKFKKDVFLPMKTCYKPNPPNESFPDFTGIIPCDDLEIYGVYDQMWTVCSISDDQMPTWPAYNSLITNLVDQTLCQSLPLYPGSPTDWSNLYTALKLVQGINVSVTGHAKTIVTLDLQLYAKCMQLREKNDILESFIFRLGELHVVFAMLKVLGEYILDSGIDRLFVEAGIYGPTTLGQIIEGKHMKRGIEAYFTMYLALSSIHLKEALQNSGIEWLKIKSRIKETISNFLNIEEDSLQERISIHNQLLEELHSSRIQERLIEFNNSLHNQSLFLRNFMKMFEVLLLFVRASRQGLWRLHLACLNKFADYFFAHDQINYARLTPLYLATMIDLETKDENSWRYLENNYSIAKSSIPFVAIGSDHAMEQENKTMKVLGGIIGLTQQPDALNRFCLTAPVLSSLGEEFLERNNICSYDRKHHYQMTGSTCERIHSNMHKLLTVMETFSVGFEPSEKVSNLVSKAVLPPLVSKELLRHETIGHELYHTFISNRLNGELSIWSSMKKCNLKTFKTLKKTSKLKIGDRIIQLKEEKNLMTRFLVTARKRPELELEQCIGNYEFSVVPNSLFTVDGQPLPCTDKAKLMHHVEDLSVSTDPSITLI